MSQYIDYVERHHTGLEGQRVVADVRNRADDGVFVESVGHGTVDMGIYSRSSHSRAAVHLEAVVCDVVGAGVLRNGLACSGDRVGEADLMVPVSE